MSVNHPVNHLGVGQGRILLPIFHLKSCSCWLPNAIKKCTNNLKCTCPTRTQRKSAQRKLYSTTLGLALGIIGLALGLQEFLDTKAYIPLRRKTPSFGGWRWAVPPTPEFCVGDTNMLVSFALGDANFSRFTRRQT